MAFLLMRISKILERLIKLNVFFVAFSLFFLLMIIEGSGHLFCLHQEKSDLVQP